jgi:glutaredoxin-like YruB-family protein
MKNVLLYTLPTCEWCNKTKEFLKTNGVIYKEVSVEGDESALNEIMNKSGQTGVPVLDIEGEIIIGFHEKKIAELLGL